MDVRASFYLAFIFCMERLHNLSIRQPIDRMATQVFMLSKITVDINYTDWLFVIRLFRRMKNLIKLFTVCISAYTVIVHLHPSNTLLPCKLIYF